MTVVPTSLAHPLDPLSAQEIVDVVRIVRERHDPSGTQRFVLISLREPDKDELAPAGHEGPGERRAHVITIDPVAETSYEGVVSITAGVVESWKRLDGVQPAIMPEEFELVERAMLSHPDFVAALQRRGIVDLELVCVTPISAGYWGDASEKGRRLCRALVWMRAQAGANPLARPVEGIVGVVDLYTGEVVHLEDRELVPLPPGKGDYRSTSQPSLRNDLRPIEITQPDGRSFTVEGNEVRWQRWSFRVGFSPREGLVLHTIGYEDAGGVRSILHRASFSEMVVPYGDPSANHYFMAAFDVGEMLSGALANSLQLGCDCLGEIYYFDAIVSNPPGEAVRIPNAICLHEEDYGLLWKHTDVRTGEAEVRRARRLTISFIATIGNYEYGFCWYFYLDGTIECEVKATGVLSTAAVAPGVTPRHGTLVAKGLNAMHHQHFFNARLDFDLDGRSNSVYEVHSEADPTGPSNPYGTAFYERRSLLRREMDSRALIDPLRGRYWLVVNPQVTNELGQPVGYKLMPGENVALMAQPDSYLRQRARFAEHHVWVTRYAPEERYAAGDYPNQHSGGDGLPAYIAANRDICNQDVVLWYTFGLHHIARPEDWPVMPVHHLGFKLKPLGFFNENPTLDVPPPEPHCKRHGA